MIRTASASVANLSFDSVKNNFLGHSPKWYKQLIIVFLIINPLLYLIPEHGGFIAGWALVLEFIFTLAMALKCYPLQPGGLLVFEAFVIGMADTYSIYEEIETGLKVILLLMFMVAGIYFMKDLLLFTFTKLLVKIRSKVLLSFLFCSVAAILSAFLDALTVTAVIITVAGGFYRVYHRVATGDVDLEGDVPDLHASDLDAFRHFLRGLMMHAAVGTALGGAMTLVGEPQNVIIADRLDWTFIEFFVNMSPVTLPVFVVGLITCVFLELTKICGYGGKIPPAVYEVLKEYDLAQGAAMSGQQKARLIVQALAAVFLVIALALHWAEVGVVGLAIIILQSGLNGTVDEHHIAPAFLEAMPFTALLAVFFALVAVIHEQHLFSPVMHWVLAMEESVQPGVFYIANGLLSAISDNVFVATVYINEIHTAFGAGEISRTQFDKLGVAINTGTNIPSILTPNGQAAFLFLLTSSLAPLIRLSYGRMVMMAIPYFITMGTMGWIAVQWIL